MIQLVAMVFFSVAGLKGSGMSYITEFVTNKGRPKYVSFIASFASLAVMLQPFIGLFIMAGDFKLNIFGVLVYKPWRLYILVNSLFSGLAALAMYFLPESPKFLLAMGKPQESLEILKRIYVVNRRKSKEVNIC